MSTATDDSSSKNAVSTPTKDHLPWYTELTAFIVAILALKGAVLDAFGAAFPFLGQYLGVLLAPAFMAIAAGFVATKGRIRSVQVPGAARLLLGLFTLFAFGGACLSEYLTLKAFAMEKLVFEMVGIPESDCHKNESAFRLFLLTATDSDFLIKACPPEQSSATISGFRRSTNIVFERGPSAGDRRCQELYVKAPLKQFQTTVCCAWKTGKWPLVTFIDDQYRNIKGSLKREMPWYERLVLPSPLHSQ